MILGALFMITAFFFIVLLQAMDSQQNMMKDNAAKACLRQITLPQEKNAKYCMQ
jgi:hypothetical protein